MDEQLTLGGLLGQKTQPEKPKKKTAAKPAQSDSALEERINKLLDQKTKNEVALQNSQAATSLQIIEEATAEIIIEEEIVEVKPEVITVTQLNKGIKGLLEKTYPFLWVKGEISNFKVSS